MAGSEEPNLVAGRAVRLRQLRRPMEATDRFAAVLAPLNDDGKALVERTRSWVGALDYHHPGQSRETYLAHPHRVATMYVEQAPHPTADGIVTALAHNVLEVTNTSEEALVEHLGRGPAAAISVLTVDRARQEDPAYLRAYYQAISETPLAPSVKVLDKVDNLYLLCLNANDRVRTRYLAEIEEHLIPLARASIPSVVPLIGALVEDNRRLGHRPLEVLMTEVE